MKSINCTSEYNTTDYTSLAELHAKAFPVALPCTWSSQYNSDERISEMHYLHETGCRGHVPA